MSGFNNKNSNLPQENNWPLGILESLHVHKERGHRHGGGDTAEDGPEPHPEGREGLLVVGEIRTVAAEGAVGDSPGLDFLVIRAGADLLFK